MAKLVITLKGGEKVVIDMLDSATETHCWKILNDQFVGKYKDWYLDKGNGAKAYTIYRVMLDDGPLTAAVWKELRCSEEDIKKEMQKLERHVTKHNFSGVFVYREDSPRDKLVIPVL